MNKKDLPPIDLKLIKQFVTDLETALQHANSIDRSTDLHTYIIEMAKASGLAAGAAQEATALVGDIYATIRSSQGPTSKSLGMDYLEELLGPLKGSGNAN